MDAVAVLDDVILALNPQKSSLANGGFGAKGQQIGPTDYLGFDETPFKIGMNRSRGLHCRRTAVNRPGATFLRADGEKRL
jgi:hypothetical protein